MSEQKNIGIDRPSFLQRLVKQKMALVIGALLYRPMGRYLTGADIE